MAHFESSPAPLQPRISPSEASVIRPEDIIGDITTNPTSPSYMLRFGGRLLSLILRARQGTCLRDAEIYSWRWVSEEDSAAIAAMF